MNVSCQPTSKIRLFKVLPFLMSFFSVKEKNDKEIVQLVNAPTKFSVGEEVTIEWEVEEQPITFKGTKQYPIRVKRNGKLVSDRSNWKQIYLPAPKYGCI